MTQAQYLYPLAMPLLVVASYFDLRTRRVPNWLIVTGALTGILSVWVINRDGLDSALQGGLGALACGLPLFLMRGLGAGDVKLLTVVGIFMGWPGILHAMLASLWAGGLFGVGVLLWQKGFSAYIARYGRMFGRLFKPGQSRYIPPAPADPSAMRIPFAPFIAIGTFFVLYIYGR